MTPWRPAEGGGQCGGASESEEGVDIVRPGHFYNLHLDYKKKGGGGKRSLFLRRKAAESSQLKRVRGTGTL